MKKIAVIFNTQTLGGAERSMVELIKDLGLHSQATFFLPVYTPSFSLDDQSLKSFLLANNHPNITTYYFPKSVYSLSKSSSKPSILLALIKNLLALYKSTLSFEIKKFDTIWCNGNKACFLLLISATLKRYRGEFIWHVRDYISESMLSRLLAYTLMKVKFLNKRIIFNSYSTQSDAKPFFQGDTKQHVVYNLAKLRPCAKKYTPMSTIGVASMMAPWKGIHQIVLWASLYEKKLMELGVQSINIYGGQIYQTQNQNPHYLLELKKLAKKLKVSILNFRGLCPPEVIYNEIDLLIHPSIEREPYGRIILEAYQASLPVISTSLGGTNEILGHKLTHSSFHAYDYQRLFDCVKKLKELHRENAIKEIIQQSYNSVHNRYRFMLEELKSSIL